MTFNIGVNVVEVDGRAPATVVAAPTSIPGFLVRSARGVPDLPVTIQGFIDFAATFGSYARGLFGAHAVRGFFDNGGSEAVVSRVVGSNAAAASAELANADATPVIEVHAGARGRQDPGEWGNALSVVIADHPRATSAIPAQIVSANAAPFTLAVGQTLDLAVNGVLLPAIPFNAGDFVDITAAAAAEVAAVINRSTTSVRASVTPAQRLLLTSAAPGPASRLAVTGAAATPLGFTGAAASSDAGVSAATLVALQGTGGLLAGSAVRIETRGFLVAPGALATSIADSSGIDVMPDGGSVRVRFASSDFADPASVTPAEVAAAINRQAAGFFAALTHDNHLMLLSSSFGPSSSIAIAAPPSGTGLSDATASLGLAGSSPVAGTRTSRAVAAVSDAGKYVSLAGAGLPAISVNAARLQSVEFDLVVKRSGADVERFESLSMQSGLEFSAVSVVNHPSTGSRFVMLTDLGVTGPGTNSPAPGTTALGAAAGTSGRDGDAPLDMHYVGDPAARTGVHAFDTSRIQLLACPETTSPGVTAALLAYCEQRGELMFVGTAPHGLDIEGLKTYASPFRAKKVFGALYAPWIATVNPLDLTGADPRLWIPPVGHVLGVYARIASARGVWKAPAGDEAVVRGALAVGLDMTDIDETDLVKNGGVNAIRAIPGSGIVVDTSRTLSTDTRWLFVNVRRLFNFVKSSLRDGLRWVAQEPHSEELRRAVRLNVVTPFLLGLWRQGAFGSDPANQVFTVKCDAQNNPPEEVNLGNFKVEVYFYPVKPAETIIITVGQQESGASAQEA
ncbi:phage tail sheath C-terminal domain-containing protein [Sorangium sp. So ce216]